MKISVIFHFLFRWKYDVVVVFFKRVDFEDDLAVFKVDFEDDSAVFRVDFEDDPAVFEVDFEDDSTVFEVKFDDDSAVFVAFKDKGKIEGGCG